MIDKEQEKMLEETLQQLTQAPSNDEPKIYDIWTASDVQQLQDDYQTTWNAERSMRKIATPLFRKYNVRSLSMLNPDAIVADREKDENIKTAFYAMCECVITKTVKKTQTITHKAGDFKRDASGNPIMRQDGNGYDTYSTTEKETVEVEIKAPLFDYKNSPRALADIRKFVENIEVPIDFNKLADKMCANIDYARGMEIIKELTQYYVFEDNDKFAERFAMMICNAKAKGLNIHPKYPVMFSLVGEMGKGKGWLATMIKKTYDQQFDSTSSKTSFKRLFGSNFNSILMTRGFIHFDEKNGIDSTQCEELKSLITEPDVEVQMKYKEPRTVRNLATFFSTTNESIKDVMGLQKDRRLVEFVLKDKTAEIPQDKMEAMLTELWQVMPTQFPDPDKVVRELLEESNDVLQVKMDEIVYDLWQNHAHDFCTGKFVSIRKMKNCLKDMGGMRSQAVVDWLAKEGYIGKYPNNSWYYDQHKITSLINNQEEVMGCDKHKTDDMQQLIDDVEGL